MAFVRSHHVISLCTPRLAVLMLSSAVCWRRFQCKTQRGHCSVHKHKLLSRWAPLTADIPVCHLPRGLCLPLLFTQQTQTKLSDLHFKEISLFPLLLICIFQLSPYRAANWLGKQFWDQRIHKHSCSVFIGNKTWGYSDIIIWTVTQWIMTKMTILIPFCPAVQFADWCSDLTWLSYITPDDWFKNKNKN